MTEMRQILYMELEVYIDFFFFGGRVDALRRRTSMFLKLSIIEQKGGACLNLFDMNMVRDQSGS